MKPLVTFSDWEKLDIRLGTIIQASAPEWSNKLIQLTVDFGTDIGERTIFTGMRKWHGPEKFQGKQALFIVNLEPRKMGAFESQGMLVSLDATDADGNSCPGVILFDNAAANGTALS